MERDQRAAVELADRERPVPGQGVAGAHRRRQLLARELESLELGRGLDLERKCDVEAPVVEHLGHPPGRSLAQRDLDVGVHRGEAREDCGDVELAAEQVGADGDVAAQEPSQLVDLAAQRRHLREHRTSARDHELAGFGELDRPGGALEQLDAELALKPADLVRQSRLGDVELVGRAGEVPVPRDRLEVAELTDVHRNIDRNTRSIHSHTCVANMNRSGKLEA